jgi:hypothetical protein
MATLLELCKIKHHAVRSDGAKFLDGVRDDSLNTSWLTVNSSGRVTLAPGLYDELLVVKGEVSDDQIKTWANLGAPFYDPSPVIPDSQIPSAEEWNRKARTFYQSSPPTATGIGDIWYDTSDNNHPYRWDGNQWVDIQDKSIGQVKDIANQKNRTYYQDTPPTGTHSLGDVWFDTSDHNRRHWWDGSKWVDAEDVSPIDASQRPVTARGLGGDIEMDKDGMRFIRKADNEVTLQMDTETGSAYFKGDITGSSGTFADGKVAIGELAGKSWGDSVLPAGTAGIWGDQAGLYLKGYAKIIDWGFAYDEDIVDVSGYPNLSNPFVVATPKEMVSSSPNSEALTHLYVDAISVGEGKYVIKAKNMIKHAVTPWGGVAATTGEFTFVQPEGYVEGKKGVHTDFFICRPTWRIVDLGLGGNTAKLWMDITDEFDSSGDPVNWRTVRNFGRMMIGSGTLNWDTALPHFGQWALRVRGKGLKILFSDVAFVGLEQSGYRGSTQYMDNEGDIFDPIDIDDPSIEPSGMSVFYFVLDRG